MRCANFAYLILLSPTFTAALISFREVTPASLCAEPTSGHYGDPREGSTHFAGVVGVHTNAPQDRWDELERWIPPEFSERSFSVHSASSGGNVTASTDGWCAPGEGVVHEIVPSCGRVCSGPNGARGVRAMGNWPDAPCSACPDAAWATCDPAEECKRICAAHEVEGGCEAWTLLSLRRRNVSTGAPPLEPPSSGDLHWECWLKRVVDGRSTNAVIDFEQAINRDRPPYSDDGGHSFVVHSATSAPLCGVYGWQPQLSLQASSRTSKANHS